jgi:hypothetical protein
MNMDNNFKNFCGFFLLLLLVVGFKQCSVSLECKYILGNVTFRCTFISNVLIFLSSHEN